MLRIDWIKYKLNFKLPAGTSRGILRSKYTYLLKVWDDQVPEVFGLGESNLFPNLSFDDKPEYESILSQISENPDFYIKNLHSALLIWPSIRFGLEMAFLDFIKGGNRSLFSTRFIHKLEGIPINGLIWMGDKTFMKEQIQSKLKDGYRCLKLKIGAINWLEEMDLIKSIRQEYSKETLELRVDANGAFDPHEALGKLEFLAKYHIHSIEQPIRQGQYKEMSELCTQSPLPIALDEELIGIHKESKKIEILDKIKPQYIILKPSLLGGFKASEEWIKLAEERNIPWWITSALESNIGLNAIAQWTHSLKSELYQGLGTGQLFTNNIDCPLKIENAKLWYDNSSGWNFGNLKFKN
mgnify:CR=1 FL=1